MNYFYRRMKNILFKFYLKNKIFISLYLIITLIIGGTILFGTYQKTIFNECYNFSDESLSNRTIYVESEDEFSDLKNNIEKYDNVLGVFNNDYYIDGGVIDDLSNKKFDGLIEFTISNNQVLPDLKIGENFPDNESYYMICPTLVFPNPKDFKKINRLSGFNLSKDINKTFEVNFDNINIDIKLIGLFDPSDYEEQERGCFVNEKVLKDIYNYRKNKTINNCLSNCDDCDNECFDNSKLTYISVIIDSYKNYDEVINKLQNDGYLVEDNRINNDEVNNFYKENINKSKKIIIVLLIFIIFIIIFINIYEILNFNRVYNILLMLGFKKNYILLNKIFIKILLLFFISIITYIFSRLVILLIRFLIYFYPLIFEKVTIYYDYHYYYLFIILFIFISVVFTLMEIILNIRKGE